MTKSYNVTSPPFTIKNVCVFYNDFPWQFELNYHTGLAPGKHLIQAKLVFNAFIFPL
jgi:hypothetical protein